MRNNKLEICRIYMALIICFHHFRLCSEKIPFGAGYLATDFFFFTSGFFLASSIDVAKKPSILKYTKRRYLRLIPDYILAFMFSLIVRLVIDNLFFYNNIIYPIKELFMIEIFSAPITKRVNPPDWYVGYMLIASIVIYIFLCKVEKFRKPLLLFSVGIAGYAILVLTNGHLNIYAEKEGILSVAIFRALSGIVIGSSIFYFQKDIRNKLNGWISIVFALSSFLISVYFLVIYNGYSECDFLGMLCLLLLFSSVLLCSDKKLVESNFFNKILSYCGKLSFPIFLFHYPVALLFEYLNLVDNYDWKIQCLLFVVVVLPVAILSDLIREKLVSLLKRMWRDKLRIM